MPLFIVGNKITDISDITWLKEAISPNNINAAIYFEPAIKRMERGENLKWQDISVTNQASLLDLWDKILLSYSKENTDKQQEFLIGMENKRIAKKLVSNHAA